MKKLFFFLLLTLTAWSAGVRAQGDTPMIPGGTGTDVGGIVLVAVNPIVDTYPWDEPEDGDYSSSYVLYATVKLNGTEGVPDDVEIGAFIDGVFRGSSQAFPDATGMNVCYRIKVEGDEADNGKTITFRAYYASEKTEYELEGTMTYAHDGTYNMPSKPYVFTLNTITNISMPSSVTIEKNVWTDFTSYLTLTPADANKPVGVIWTVGDEEYLEADGAWIRGLKGTKTGVPLSGSYGGFDPFSTTVYVKVPATSLEVTLDLPATITVAKDDATSLNLQLENSYQVLPTDATEDVVWSIGDNTIIQPLTGAVGFNPVKGGTTTMTPQILNADGSVRLSGDPITVIVTVPVTDVSLVSTTMFQCNVGDDIYSRLMDILSVSPDDATDKSIKWSQVGGDAANVNITDGSIVTTLAGTCTLRATSVSNPDKYGEIRITINNPAKTVDVVADPLYINFVANPMTPDGSMNISMQVKNNLTFGPDGYSSKSLQVSSSDPDVVTVRTVLIASDAGTGDDADIEAYAKKAGSADITVELSWYDYATNTTETSIATFKVVVSETVQKINATLDGGELVWDPNGGSDVHLQLTAEPAGATFDINDVTIELEDYADRIDDSGQKATDWVTAEVTQDGNGEFYITPKNPGQFGITIRLNGNEIGDEVFDVQIPVTLNDGWSWKTLRTTYAHVDNDSENEYAALLEKIVEARTQTALTYNDPDYGFFGDLEELAPNQCVKIKIDNGGSDLNLSYVMGEGNTGIGIRFYKGWTWIPNPYLYDRKVGSVLTVDDDGTYNVGDRIISKTGGFMEYDGTNWVGSLTTLKYGEGYLYHNTGDDYIDVTYGNEYDLLPANEVDVTPINAKSTGTTWVPWSYDASPFRDNMSMIATIDGMASISDYSVGAYVGDECRGEGTVVDNRFFVTVHGNSGETVSFRLFNKVTGELFAVNGTLPLRQLVGSLREPQKLQKGALLDVFDVTTMPEVVDGIGEITTNQTVDGDFYTLNGVKVSRSDMSRKGVYIVKTKNGTKKIIR